MNINDTGVNPSFELFDDLNKLIKEKEVNPQAPPIKHHLPAKFFPPAEGGVKEDVDPEEMAEVPTKESYLSDEFVKKLENSSTDLPLNAAVKDAIKRTKDVKDLEGVGQRPFDKGWLKVVDQWVYIDYNKGKIGFYENNTSDPTSPHFVYTTKNEKGEPTQKSYFPAIKLYQARDRRNLETLASSLKNLGSSEDLKQILISHLALKAEKLPPPSKAPHLYLSPSDFPSIEDRDVPVEKVLLRINLCEGQQFSLDLVDAAFTKVDCFSKVDTLIQLLASESGELDEKEEELDGEERPHVDLVELRLLKFEILKALEKLGDNLNDAEKEQIQLALNYLKDVEKKAQEAVLPRGVEFYTADNLKRLPIPTIEFPAAREPENDPSLENASRAENAPEAALAGDAPKVLALGEMEGVENELLAKEALNVIAEEIGDINTLPKALEKIDTLFANLRNASAAWYPSLINRLIPVHLWDNLSDLSDDQRKSIAISLDSIHKKLIASNPKLSDPESCPISSEGQKNDYFIASLVLGYASFKVAQSFPSNPLKGLHFRLHPLVMHLKKGGIFSDPNTYKRAKELEAIALAFEKSDQRNKDERGFGDLEKLPDTHPFIDRDKILADWEKKIEGDSDLHDRLDQEWKKHRCISAFRTLTTGMAQGRDIVRQILVEANNELGTRSFQRVLGQPLQGRPAFDRLLSIPILTDEEKKELEKQWDRGYLGQGVRLKIEVDHICSRALEEFIKEVTTPSDSYEPPISDIELKVIRDQIGDQILDPPIYKKLVGDTKEGGDPALVDALLQKVDNLYAGWGSAVGPKEKISARGAAYLLLRRKPLLDGLFPNYTSPNGDHGLHDDESGLREALKCTVRAALLLDKKLLGTIEEAYAFNPEDSYTKILNEYTYIRHPPQNYLPFLPFPNLKEFPAFKTGSAALAMGARHEANQIVNAMERHKMMERRRAGEYQDFWIGNSPFTLDQQQELATYASDPSNQFSGALSYVLQHPATMAFPEASQKVAELIFNAGSMNDAIVTDGGSLIREKFPAHTKKALSNLKSLLLAPEATPEEKNQYALAIMETLVLSERVFGYVQNYAEVEGLSGEQKGALLGNYQFIEAGYASIKKLLESRAIPDDTAIASVYLDSLKPQGLQKKAVQARVLFYAAVYGIAGSKGLKDPIADFLYEDKRQMGVKLARIAYYLKRTFNYEPAAIAFDTVNGHFIVTTTDKQELRLDYGEGEEKLGNLLGLKQLDNKADAFLPHVKEKLEEVDGRPFRDIPITQKGDSYEISDRPYFFNAQGEIGRKWQSSPEDPLLRLSYISQDKRANLVGLPFIISEKDSIFVDSANNHYVFINDQLAYRFVKENDAYAVERYKDKAVASIGVAGQKLLEGDSEEVLWYQNERPYSVQTKDPQQELMIRASGEESTFEDPKHTGFFLAASPFFPYQGTNLREVFEEGVFFQNAVGDLLIKVGGQEIFVKNNRLSSAHSWDLLDLVLKTNSPTIINHVLSYIELDHQQPPPEIIQNLQGEIGRLGQDPLSTSLAIRLVCIENQFGTQGKISDIDLTQQLVVLWEKYTHLKSFSPDMALPSAIEKRFLDHLRGNFIQLEKDLLQEIQGSKDEGPNQEEAGGKNLIERLASRLAPSKKKEKLLLVRGLYHQVFAVSSAPTWQHLQKGETEKLTTWIHIKSTESLMEDTAPPAPSEKISSAEFAEKINGAITTAYENESFANDLQAFTFGWWKREVEGVGFADKNEWTKDHLLGVYHLLTTCKKEESEQIKGWLTFATPTDTDCLSLAEVAKNPHHYPSIKKVTDLLDKAKALKVNLEEFQKATKEQASTIKAEKDRLRRTLDMSPLQSGKNNINKQIGKLDQREEKLDSKLIQSGEAHAKKLAQLEKKRLQLFPKKNRLIQLVESYVKPLFSALKMQLALRKIDRPLKISTSSLAREFATYKAPADRSHLGANERLTAYDDIFDKHFTNLKNGLLTSVKLEVEGVNPVEDKLASPDIERVEKKAQEYREYVSKKGIYELNPEADLISIATSLKDSADALQQELKTMEAALLHKANFCGDVSKQLKFDRRNRPVDWGRLQKLMAKGQLYDYGKHLADPDVAKELEGGFFACLVMRTRFMQLKRVEAALAAAANPDLDDSEKKAAVANLALHLGQVREYDLRDPLERQLLFIESASPKGLFSKEQIEQARTQKDLVGTMRRLADMPTGFGKSDYFVPGLNALLNPQLELEAQAVKKFKAIPGVQGKYLIKGKSLELISKSRRLILNIWPAALADINKETLASKTAASINGAVAQLRLSRAGVGLDQIENLVHMIEKCQRKKIPISVRSSDVAAIFLHYIEVMEALSVAEGSQDKKGVEYNAACAQGYMRILSVLIDTSVATIDESREVLSPMEKTVYTLGKPTKAPTYAADFACDFFFMLMEVPAKGDGPSFKELIEKNDNLPTAKIEALTKEFITDPDFVANLAQKLGVDNGEELKAYLFGTSDTPPRCSVNLDRKDNYNLQKMDLARGYYTLLVKSALSGAVGETFGLSKLYGKDCQYAIPYEKKDIPKESLDAGGPSSYQNVDEILLKTVRTYMHRGLSPNDVDQYIETVWAEYQRDRTKYGAGEIGDRSTAYNQLMTLLTQVGVNEPHRVLTSGQGKADLKALLVAPQSLAKLEKDQPLIKEFISVCVLKQILVFPETIDMTPQDMLLMIKQSVSMSGTPQPAEAHTIDTKTSTVPGLSGKMQELIVSRTTAIREKPTTNEQLVADLVKGYEQRNVRAVIDPNAQIKFPSNHLFAQALAEKFQTADLSPAYIVYFDQNAGSLLRMKVSDPSVLTPYSEEDHNKDKHQTFTIYDQARSVGLDVKQMDNACGIVLGGPSLSLDAGIQAWGRMRGLGNQQTVEVWVTKAPQTATMLTDSEDPQINKQKVENFRSFLTTNQVEADKPLNLAAFKQLMKSELKIPLLVKMVNAGQKTSRGIHHKPDVKKALSHYRKYRGEFVSTQEYNPSTSYGSIGEPIDTRVALEALRKDMGKKANRYLDKKERKPVVENLAKYPARWANASLPEKDQASSTVGASQETQQETQQEAQKEVHVQKEEVRPQAPHIPRTSHDAWPQKLDDIQLDDKNLRSHFAAIGKRNKDIDDILKTTGGRDGEAPLSPITQRYRIAKLEFKKSRREKAIAKIFENKKNVKFIPVKEAIQSTLPSELKEAADVFTPNFYMSSNYSNLLEASAADISANTRKIMVRVLIVSETKDDGSTLFSAVALDSHDSKEISLLMKKSEGQEGRQYAICNVTSGDIEEKTPAFNPDHIKSQDVQDLLLQAKILRGKPDFSIDDQKLLVKKVNEKVQHAFVGFVHSLGETPFDEGMMTRWRENHQWR